MLPSSAEVLIRETMFWWEREVIEEEEVMYFTRFLD